MANPFTKQLSNIYHFVEINLILIENAICKKNFIFKNNHTNYVLARLHIFMQLDILNYFVL